MRLLLVFLLATPVLADELLLDEVRAFSVGLSQLGVKAGDKVAIVGDNRPRLYWSICSAQALGAIPIPVYQDSVADEMIFALEHAGVTCAVVENQEQVDKILEAQDRLPALTEIFYDDERGMRDYGQDHVRDFAGIQEEGREFDRQNPGYFEEQIAQGKGSDVAIFLYTSGTTGTPKGVVLTHDNLCVNIRDIQRAARVQNDDISLSWMPLTHDMGLIGYHLSVLAAGMNHAVMDTNAFVRRPLLWMIKASELRATQLCSPNFGYKHFLKLFEPILCHFSCPCMSASHRRVPIP